MVLNMFGVKQYAVGSLWQAPIGESQRRLLGCNTCYEPAASPQCCFFHCQDLAVWEQRGGNEGDASYNYNKTPDASATVSLPIPATLISGGLEV